MRIALSILGVIFCLASGVPANSQPSTDRAADLVQIFERVCLETGPLLAGADDRLREQGFDLTPAGDRGMFELWHEGMRVGGHLHLPSSERAPSCGFHSETVTREALGPLVESVLARRAGAVSERWKNADPHAVGWRISAGEHALYVSVSTDPSDDPARSAGVVLEINSP